MKHIYFTVTNDLTYDQRMHRICTSLSNAGYRITLVGRRLDESKPLQKRSYTQKRIRCFFNKGFAFYAEYNFRLFFYLLTRRMDGLCAIDLDTILPCLFVSRLKKVPRVYDAHEYFTELKEVRTRPHVRRFWSFVEGFAVPKFALGYTVSEGLAEAFKKKYGRSFQVIRNLPVLRPLRDDIRREDFLVFQGAVNEARGFEYLIPAMRSIPYRLVICGDGNFMAKLNELIVANGVQDKVELKGMMLPEEMWLVAQQATLGIGLAEKEGINQFYALPNKFLEYMHAALPQVSMDFPEYRKINDQYDVAILLDDLSVANIVQTIFSAMTDKARLKTLGDNARKARELFCWQQEEKILIDFYRGVFK